MKLRKSITPVAVERAQVVKVVKGVFSGLNPSVTDNSRNASNRATAGTSVNSKRSKTDQYRDWIGNNRPYYYFITLTFGKFLGFSSRVKYTNELLHRINNVIFRRTYKKRNMCMKGFAFLENHKSSKFSDRYHIHMLIQEDIRYDELGFDRVNDIFHTVAGEAKCQGTRVFNKKYIDFQQVKEDDEDQWKVIDYCMKHIWDRVLLRIKPIGINGLSDKDPSI